MKGLAGILITLTAGPLQAATVLPDFTAATFLAGSPIDNPYLPLLPGFRRVFEASGVEDGETFTQRSVMSYAGMGPTLLGVSTTAIRDRETLNGRIVEETLDYYAQDTDGNVWYLGEDVTNYRYDEEDNFIGTDSASAWLAGVNGAMPGYIMPATPGLGFSYFQEFAADDGALDEALVLSKRPILDGYLDVLVTFESTALDPDARELKYYAKGLGLFRVDEDVDDSYGDPGLVVRLVDTTPVPLSSSACFLVAALGGLVGFIKRKRSCALV